MSASRLTADARRVLVAQALRALAYGFGSVLLGVTLDERGFSSTEAGLIIAAVVTGTVLASVLIGRYADRVGRRRCYVALYVALACVGVAFAVSSAAWLLIAFALTGALSTEVTESGPFTSLEQSILATELSGDARVRGFGVYNAVASAAGSLGALLAGGLSLLHGWWPGAPANGWFFLVFVPVALAGATVARSLTEGIETTPRPHRISRAAPPLGASRGVVTRLAGLFALDSFGGGFVVQAFIAYWLAQRFGVSLGTVGLVFFAVGVLQTGSFLVAASIARRFGLLHTMVFTHLPSNLLLTAIAFAPTLPVAVGLLLARTALSQMDVPTRQAYVMALVTPEERTVAAAYTNTARYLVRPAGPALAGAAQSVALGLPFVIAGSIKSVYDLILWRWFSRVDVPGDGRAASTPSGVEIGEST
ncbi:MAG: MFS transporter [Acidimicrobiia bacterium]